MEIPAGILEFAVTHRAVGGDGGATLQVYGEVDGKRVQLLRFDCFQKAPHYHYDPDGQNVEYKLDTLTMGDPIEWTLHQLRVNLSRMVLKAGYEPLAKKVDPQLVASALAKLEPALRSAASG